MVAQSPRDIGHMQRLLNMNNYVSGLHTFELCRDERGAMYGTYCDTPLTEIQLPRPASDYPLTLAGLQELLNEILFFFDTRECT